MTARSFQWGDCLSVVDAPSTFEPMVGRYAIARIPVVNTMAWVAIEA